MDYTLLHPRYWLSWFGAGCILLLSWLPRFFRHGLGKGLGKLAYRYNHKRRKIVLANLNYCFPEFSKEKKDDICKQHFSYAAMSIVDHSVLIFGSKRRLQKMVVLEDKQRFEDLAGQGALLLLAHSTFLDFVAPAVIDYRPFASYKPFKNKVIDVLILRYREAFSEGLLTRSAGFKGIIKALKQHKMFVYLPDEDMGGKQSVFVPFFAGTKATLTTVARLQKSTGCAAVPMMVFWDQKLKKYVVKSTPSLPLFNDLEKDAAALNQALESLVSEDIAQYMWTMKLFRTRPEGDPEIY